MNEPGNEGSHQTLEKARNGFSPRASRGSTALPIPWFQPNETHFNF